MRHFTHLGSVDVIPLLLQIERHPELWDANDARTGRAGSPHIDVSDIWLRWRPPAQLVGPESYNEKFAELVWYPPAAVLTEARIILLDIMRRVRGLALGGALITRIPPGGSVRPHTDAASWHANYYGTKVYTTLKSNPAATNWTAGEALVMAAGECWTFDNLKEHSVVNEGAEDRITMMAAIRCD